MGDTLSYVPLVPFTLTPFFKKMTKNDSHVWKKCERTAVFIVPSFNKLDTFVVYGFYGKHMAC